jgi:Na+-transporting methylmalonyl-CoA/oxaloacetate decarboxylase gamma subunit
MENNFMYTEEQLMARLKFFIGVCLSFTLVGIVFVVLYSLIFVTQPLNAISPIDQKFFELIVPIATFLTGTLSGIMLAGNDKDAQKAALTAANAGWSKPPAPVAPTPSAPSPMGGMPRPAMPTMMTPTAGVMQASSVLAEATTMPVYEAGDPTHRNSRND